MCRMSDEIQRKATVDESSFFGFGLHPREIAHHSKKR